MQFREEEYNVGGGNKLANSPSALLSVNRNLAKELVRVSEKTAVISFDLQSIRNENLLGIRKAYENCPEKKAITYIYLFVFIKLVLLSTHTYI